MAELYCNVALPVPLRSTFTYRVPEALRGQVQEGSRVLVPFRKKSLVGVVVEIGATAPEGAQLRDVSRVLDLAPALTSKMLELGKWITRYYLAPIGEVFRAMLPPQTEIALRRQILLTDAGKAVAEKLKDRNALTAIGGEEADFLERLFEKKSVLTLRPGSQPGISAQAFERLERRGYVEVRETAQGRKRKTQLVAAWKQRGDPKQELGE